MSLQISDRERERRARQRAASLVSPSPLYTIAAAMWRLSVSHSQIYKLIGAKRLDVVYLGDRCPRLTFESVEALARGER